MTTASSNQQVLGLLALVLAVGLGIYTFFQSAPEAKLYVHPPPRSPY